MGKPSLLFFFILVFTFSLVFVSAQQPIVRLGQSIPTEEELVATTPFVSINPNPEDIAVTTWINYTSVSQIPHNDLGGLQGGASGEYYHLNQTIFNYLISNIYSWITSFTDTSKSGGAPYLYNDSTTIYLNETKLNGTIDLRISLVNVTDTHVAGDGIYLYNDTTTMYLNETKLNGTIKANEGNLNVNSSDYWDDLNNETDIFGSRITNDLNWVSVSNVTGFFWNETNNTLHPVNLSKNVGIGTTNSNEELNVVGEVNVTSNFWVNFLTLFVDAISGRVGIGTRTPQQLLNVVGDANFTSDFWVDEDTFFVNATDNFVGIGTRTPVDELNIIGDLNQSGGNATVTLIYGEMFNYEPSGILIDIPAVATFVNITNLSAGSLNGISFSDNTLTTLFSSMYMIQFSITATGSANSRYAFGISVNDVIQNKSIAERTIGAGGILSNQGSSAFIYLNIGDRVNLQVQDINPPAQDITYTVTNINMVRIGE